MIRRLTRAAARLPEWAISFVPGSAGRRLRAAYWKMRLGGMGDHCVIDIGVVIESPENVFLGDNVWIDNYVMIIAGPPTPAVSAARSLPNPDYAGEEGQVRIGHRTHIAPFALLQGHGGIAIGQDITVGAHVCIYSYSHHHEWNDGRKVDPDDYHSVPKCSGQSPNDEQSMVIGPVTMADASVVFANSVVLPGSRIGRYSVIGAGSVVRGTVTPGTIGSGNPLQIRKHRFNRAS